MNASLRMVRFRSPLHLSALLFCVLGCLGCGAPSEPGGSQASMDRETSLVSARALVGSEWVAESLAGVPVLEEVRLTIRFDAVGGVSGNAGCNDFNGTYVIVRERMRFGTLSSPRRNCPGSIGEQERRFHEVLAETSLVGLVDGALVMRSTEEGAETRFVPSPTG